MTDNKQILNVKEFYSVLSTTSIKAAQLDKINQNITSVQSST